MPPAVEEHIFFERGICGAAGEVGLVERAAAHAVPLTLYNLKNGSKIDEYLFPDAPVYTRFSTAGNRLLVLTAQQVAYVIAVDALSCPAGRSPELPIAPH